MELTEHRRQSWNCPTSVAGDLGITVAECSARQNRSLCKWPRVSAVIHNSDWHYIGTNYVRTIILLSIGYPSQNLRLYVTQTCHGNLALVQLHVDVTKFR